MTRPRPKLHSGFHARQIAAVTVTAVAVALATALINAAILVRVQVLEARDRAELLARTLYHMARDTLRQQGGDVPARVLAADHALRRFAEAVVGYSPIALYAAIKDENGVAILHSDPRQEGRLLTRFETFDEFSRRGATSQLWALTRSDRVLVADLPFSVDGVKPSGSAVVAVSMLLVRRRLLTTVATSASVAGGVALLAFLGSFLVANRLLAPVKRLRAELARIDPGEGQPPLDLRTEADVGRLVEFFAAVGERLAGDQRQAGDERKWAGTLASLSRLTSGVAHEIRSPLNALVLQVALLRQKLGDAPPETRGHLDVVEDAVKRLDRVIQGFLKFTRPEEIQAESVRLEPIVRDVLGLVAARAEQSAVRLESHLSSGLPAVRGSAELLRQALLNLTSNALDAMPSGGVLRVRTESSREGSVHLVVQDTGVGIPAQELAKVFDLFYTTKSDGNGIGLSFVYRIAQLHGGDVRVDSEPGVGTRVTMTLPEGTA